MENEARDIPGWGAVIDVDGDCKIATAGTALQITVPGKLHDLFPPNSVMNAPRVLTKVKGDFTVQVKVSADFDPGTTPTEGFDRAFHGAGLLLWQDGRNYFRFERGEMFRPDSRRRFYYAPTLQLRVNGFYIERLGPPARSRPVFTEAATHFRVKREGTRMTAWYSRDGDFWQIAKEFNSFDAEEIQVGVCAINTAAKDFTVTFDELKITKD